MKSPSLAAQLAAAHPVISKQVSAKQIKIILHELEAVLANNIAGDIVEFGCYKGTTSLFIRRLLDKAPNDKAFHVYDSFEGLPAKAPEDASASGEQFIAGELAVSKKMLLQEFQKANLTLPIVHKGWFSELDEQDVPSEISFAFLDGDFYDSILDSLSLIWHKLAPGAVVIFDDYAREALPGVARAVQDFNPDLPDKIITSHNLGILYT